MRATALPICPNTTMPNDIVEACGQDANVAQPRQLLHHRSCDDYLINKNGIGILRAFDNLLGCRTVVDDAIAQLPESVP